MLERLLATAAAVPFAIGTLLGHASAPGEVAFAFRDPEIVESSGLVAEDDGLVVTVNDSGDSGRVFAVDPATGRTVGTTSWAGDPTDVEALAPAGPGQVWVGDIGDNTGDRDDVEVLRVPVGRGERHVDPPRYRLAYPDGPRNAEALLADPRTGRLYVVSKEVFGGTVYAAPRRLRTDVVNRLRPVADAPPIVTDGAFFPDGRHYVLRGYGDATVYTFPGREPVGSFRLPDQRQGEGIAVAHDGSLLVSTEGQFSDVLRVRLPRGVRRAVTQPPALPSASPSSPSPSPSAGSTASTPASDPAAPHRAPWPWLLGGLAGLAGLAIVLVRLRPR